MKKFITIIALLTFNFTLYTLNCHAQLLNGDFENWSPQYNFENPDHWETLNVLSLFSNPLSAFKATGIDKHSGNYALKLKTVFLSNNPAPQSLPDTIGYVFSGKIIVSPPSLKLGIPFTDRPKKMEFWSKYVPVGNDTGAISVVLQKWNGLKADTIADGYFKISTTLTYSFFQINLHYYSPALPDTAITGFSSSYNKYSARIGSTLYIDDVALTGWVGIDESGMSGTDKVQVFPNPAKNNLNILAQSQEADNVQVMDVSGKLVDVYKIQNYRATINTGAFAEGLFFYEIRDKKNRTLNKGKFNVTK